MIYNYLKGFLLSGLMMVTSLVMAQNYTVTPIPHQVYTASLPVNFTADDTYSPVITMPFYFEFFGNTYNQFVVSSNGAINFNTSLAGTTAPWAFSSSVPSTNFPEKNSILGCFSDMDNSNAEGTVTYAIVGSAPFRKMVVMFDNNSHFMCATVKSSFQMVLYETLNIIDSQIIERQVCPGWNGGKGVIGILNGTGTVGYTPPGRNTGTWLAVTEGWRFSPENASIYQYAVCDDNGDGFATFDLTVVQNDLATNGSDIINFYETQADAESEVNPIAFVLYTNIAPNQTLYYSLNGAIGSLNLTAIDCTVDYDSDGVATLAEDLNGDGNLANDDTDADGIANYIDNEDDGDLILTNVEYVFTDRNSNAVSDTDGDGIPNYLDNDDDGDGVLTINEDYNNNNNPLDDDINEDGIADYLQSTVLGTAENVLEQSVKLYPNPAQDVLQVRNTSGETMGRISIYSINGLLVGSATGTGELTQLPVAGFSCGVYFVNVEISNRVVNLKFVKK